MANEKTAEPAFQETALLEAERILYISDSCVVVNKRCGEATQSVRAEGTDNLPLMLAAALNAGKKTPAALSVPAAPHRLDVPVSGCVLFARTQEALVFLNAAFAASRIEKRYWAVVEKPQEADAPRIAESGELVHWLSFDPRKNKSMAHNDPEQGRKKAVMQYRIAGEGRNYLFLEIELVTGRHHQIRAQLERIGLRIKGDLKYGAKRSEKNGGIRLHARSLSFPDPQPSAIAHNGGIITVIADPPLPDNLWLAFADAAARNSAAG